jgi:uncharacterized protein YndB with AHSA1/START domain
VWQVIEQAAIADAPGRVWRVLTDIEGHADLAGGDVRAIRMHGPLAVGTTFEVDMATRDGRSFVTQNRVDVVREARELAWTSYRSSPDEPIGQQLELHWWIRLAPGWTGTDVEYGCRLAVPDDADEGALLEGTDHTAAVRAAMLVTLANLKTRTEVSDR